VTERLFRALDVVLGLLLLAMVVMVFGNVVLRYAFNSGITVSEELSRYCFVWLTFVGAIVAVREGTHLGMDSVVARLPPPARRACAAACQVLTLLCCAILVWGTWRQHEVNATTMAPVTGMSMIWVFGMGYVTGLAIGVQAAHRLAGILSGRIVDGELFAIRGEDEPAAAHGARA
jgi:TRAP-type transport system small permease protein